VTAPVTVGRDTVAITAVTAAGCALLAARPILYQHAPPVAAVVILFTALLAVGVVWPLAHDVVHRTMAVPALAAGVGLFALGRVLTTSPRPNVNTREFLVLMVLASLAEEALFRRLIYGALLERGGPVLAVAGSTLLFAAVHVSIYGYWVLPLDLAAGAVLGWQRWATGSWLVPGITHIVANLLLVV
jgi:membrane protease YdiL (CAAX protease family)